MCDERERLIEYLYDEGAPADRRRVEAHVGECADCRDELRAFGRVREDLLAWEVPDAGSVWTPFAPSAPLPWYQQVPAWAMAAAAGLMLVLGGLGGGVGAQLFRPAAPDASIAQVDPGDVGRTEPAVALPVAATSGTLARPEGLRDEDILALVRREMARVPVSAAPQGLAAAEAQALVADAAQQHWARVYDYLTQVARERELERRSHGGAISHLTTQVATLENAVAILVQEQQKRGQQ